MLPSARTRARSRIQTSIVQSKASSRLRTRSTASHKIKFPAGRRLSHLIHQVWRFITSLQLAQWPFGPINFPALGLSLFGWMISGILLSQVPPSVMWSWPGGSTYWPVLLLLGWNLWWLTKGLGLSTPTTIVISYLSVWWLWLRLIHVKLNIWLILTTLGLVVILYSYIYWGEKYLFSRKSIRKGILR